MTDFKKLLKIKFLDARYHGGEIEPKLVVVHHTATVDVKNKCGRDCEQYLATSDVTRKPSVHFHVGISGEITIYRNVIGMTDQWVKRANHAGNSSYTIGGIVYTGLNNHTIGIEVAGDTNRYPLTEAQHKALVLLGKWINQQFPQLARRERWVRHADIATPRGRKVDIGTKYFNFGKFLEEVFGNED